MARFTRVLITLAAVAVLLATPRQAAAQAAWTAPVAGWGSHWCPTCYVALNVDVPNLTTAWNGTIQGWGFECASGQPVDASRVDVYYQDADGLRRAKAFFKNLNISRPDVEKYFLPLCPHVTSTAGFTIGFHEPIPAGTWIITVVVWKGAIATSQTGLVVVTDSK